MYNFRYNIKNKGISLCKQHNKNTQPPFPLYVVVKLYSSSQLKTLVNWPYFCADISLPYKNLPELTRDITNWMISQHNRDGAFLPLTLKKGYINGIAKGNINQNSKSTIATRHYHGTSLSIFQFPTEENLGIAVKYGDLKNSSNQSFWKLMHIQLLTHALKLSYSIANLFHAFYIASHTISDHPKQQL